MFSQFGKIIDVVCLKTLRMRGQAWVVFADVGAATNAKNTMQNFPFFDKPIVSGTQLGQSSQHAVPVVVHPHDGTAHWNTSALNQQESCTAVAAVATPVAAVAA
jgi:RNA recognition motif-containing protein